MALQETSSSFSASASSRDPRPCTSSVQQLRACIVWLITVCSFPASSFRACKKGTKLQISFQMSEATAVKAAFSNKCLASCLFQPKKASNEATHSDFLDGVDSWSRQRLLRSPLSIRGDALNSGILRPSLSPVSINTVRYTKTKAKHNISTRRTKACTV